MAKRNSKFDRLAKSMADQLTSEQYIKLIQIADPLSEQEAAEFALMSDDDLLKALAD